jgi:drug/metabolite transporter (DMT)-like permease
VTIILALASALVFGGGVALQQRAAQEAPEELAGRFGLLLRLIHRPLWMLGLGADIGGFALQAAALSRGSLVVVQPLITTSLLVTLVCIAASTGVAITGREWAAIALVLGGLVVLLTVGSPHEHGSAVIGLERWLLCASVLAGIAITSLMSGLRAAGMTRAALLALAAGVGDAFMAVLTKAFATTFGHGVGHLVLSWTPYALVGAGTMAMLLTQTAYQAGRPTVTLPIITVTEPVISSVVGIVLFGDVVEVGVFRTPAVILAIAALISGLVYLARTSRLAAAQVAESELTYASACE